VVVEVYGHDINESSVGFTIEKNGIRFGLLAIKGVAEGPLGEIVRARSEGRQFKSLADFCTRVDHKFAGKGVVETLVKAGAMDSLGDGKRHILLASVERAIQFGKSERTVKEQGMMSLFGEIEQTHSSLAFSLSQDAKEISRKQLLEWERELIGVYTSKHPLAYLSELFKDKVTHTSGDISEESDKQKVVIGGMIKETRRITTKKGDTMCVVLLEDMYGSIGITIFPKLYEQTTELWVEETVVIVRGEVQVRRDEPGILCTGVERLKSVEEEMNRKEYLLSLRLQLSGTSELAVSDDIMKVQDIHRHVHASPGRDRYEIFVANGEWVARLTPGDNTVQYSLKLHRQLESILGVGMLQVEVVNRG